MVRGPEVELEEELGSGATATVSRARLLEDWPDPAGGPGWSKDAGVAVKTLRPELAGDPAARAALAAEAAAGARARHPSLVRVLGLDDEVDPPRLVLELVGGRSLRELLDEEGALPEPRVRRLGAQLAGALAALHAAGLAHGDVKPENAREDEEGRAVLLDLGLAGARCGGTLAYLAPERARGGEASAAADVFALGLVLVELATGRAPLGEAGDGPALLRTLAEERLAPPSRRAPTLSALFYELALATLALDPAARPTAAELARRLEEGEAGAWWRAHAAERAAGTRPSASRGHLLPLVGRDAELEALARALEAATADARGGALWIEGPEGAGKSRLVEELADRARLGPRPPVHLYGRCRQHEEARPSAPLLACLRRYLSLPPAAAPGPRERARLEGLVPPHHAASLLAALDPDAGEAASLSGSLARVFAAIAEHTPLLLFVDDVQRADGGTLSALRRLSDRLAGRSLLLVLGLREDEPPARGEELEGLRARLAARAERDGGPHLDTLELPPLAREAVDELVRRVFHHTTPRLRLAEELWRRCRGGPGLLAEVLRDALARGDVVRRPEDDGRLRLVVAHDELPQPASLAASVAARVRALSEDDRRWVERLAVVGGRIQPAFLVEAFPPTARAEVDAVLGRLVRGGWIVPAGALYRFARPALREAVYRALPEPRRLRLHAAAAGALGDAPGRERTLEDRFQEAFHLRAARRPSSLLKALQPLLAEAGARGQAQRLRTLAGWGLDALDALGTSRQRDRLRVELLELAADAADRLGRRAEERDLLERLADLSVDPALRPELAARVYLLHGRYALATGELGMAGGLLRNAAQFAARAEDPALESDALRRLAHARAQAGALDEARGHARRAALAAPDERARALAWLARAKVDVLEDRLDSGLRTVARALRLLRRADASPPGGVVALGHLLRARILRSAGLPARAFASASRARVLAARAGERRLEAEAGARLGALLLDLDRPEEAEARLRDALLSAREIEDPRGEVLALVWLGLLLLEDYDPEARATLDRAVARARETGYARAEALARALRAREARHVGDHARAEADSLEALAILDRVGAEVFDRVAIVGTRVLVLRSAGRDAEAEPLLERARKRLARDTRRLSDRALRAARERYAARLVDAVLSPDGVIFPRRTTSLEGDA